MRVPEVLWAYKTTCKNLNGKRPFRLVYGIEVVMPMEYIVPSLCIAVLIAMVDHGAWEERLMHLAELEEDRFLARFFINKFKRSTKRHSMINTLNCAPSR